MLIPLINIAVGAALFVGGAMGELTFIGTNSSAAAMAIGGIIAGIGVIQMVRAARRR